MAGAARLDRRRAGLTIAAVVSVLAAAVSIVPPLVDSADGVDDLLVGVVIAYGAVLYVLVGVVVLWSRPGNGIGRLAILIGLGFSQAIFLAYLDAWLELPSAIGIASQAVILVGWIAGGSLLVVWFPDGRRTSRLGGFVEVVLVVAVIGIIVTSARDELPSAIAYGTASAGLFDWISILGFGGLGLAYLGSFVDLALRYRRADVVASTQMRWVLAAEALSLSLLICFGLFGEGQDWLFLAWFASMGLPVLAIAIAITRYHLYEIDRIIGRTISYAAVTGVLFAVFVASTLLLQRAVTGAFNSGRELEPWVVAASTLIVAALFNPVRVRVQSAVDRRFHRERYDTARIVAAFSGRLRDELDLPTVTGELRATTGQALEPVTTGVWLRQTQNRP